MDLQEILALYDKEQRLEIAYQGVLKEVSPYIVRFIRPAPGRNFITYSDLDETNADGIIAEQITYFSHRNQPFEWKAYTHDTPADLYQRLAKHGLTIDEPEAVMVLDLERIPASLNTPITADVRPITAREQLEDVIEVEKAVWGHDFSWIKERLGDHLLIKDYLSVYVAYIDDQPACAGWTYFHPRTQFASLWGGSTVAKYRQKGLYTAILATRVQEARQRHYRFLTVDTSLMSQSIVAQHGFHLLTHAYDCHWQCSPLATTDSDRRKNDN